jgi:HSP20 family protein
MSLVKTAPLAVVKQDMDRVFERLFGGALWPELPKAKAFEVMWEPALDFSEAEKEFVVRLEIPGVTRDDLDVTIDGTLLTLSGKREMMEEKKGEDFLWQERHAGRFMRTLRLPAPVKESEVMATYENGILTVKLPKLPLPSKNKVTIT